MRVRLGAADSAYAAGEPALAERNYFAVLRLDPDNSHAVFRLAQLSLDRPQTALRLFRRYVTLEPQDAWGHIALADALARLGHTDDALAQYDTAEQRAPGDRDVRLGRARVLARAHRTDAAIALYERWTTTHPEDVEAWRELAVQRQAAGRARSAIAALEHAQARVPNPATARRLRSLRATVAPWVETAGGGSRDSDGNQTAQLGLSIGATRGDAVGLRVTSSVRRVRNGALSSSIYDAGLGGSWRPTATARVESRISISLVDSLTGRGAVRRVPSGEVRFDWREPDGGAALGIRAGRTLLVASPALAWNQVVRDEIAGRAELAIAGPLRVRGLARGANISSAFEQNRRTLLGGGLVVGGSVGELSATVQQIEFAHPSTSGYFAPRRARIAEIGTYAELESAAGVRLALDLGAGAQQVMQWGAAVGGWSPAYRLWSEVAVPLAPGRELRLELEGYDSRIGSDVATSAGWHFGSALIALRWAL